MLKSAVAQAAETGTGSVANRDLHMTDQDFQTICALIHRHAGIALAPHKKEMVYSRLARRLRHYGMTQFKDYLALLQRSNSDEWEAFTNALTTNLTSFFREAQHFDVMAEYVKTIKHAPRIWSCAASTGEELYSIGMTLYESLGPAAGQAKVLGTDIDTQVLTKARQRVYTLEGTRSVGEARLRRFFLRGKGDKAGLVRVSRDLTNLVEFRRLNLLDAQWDIKGPFDIIFCRNIMIYFDHDTQTKLLDRIADLLAPGGLFFAGHSENFSAQTRKMKLIRNTVYRRMDH